MQRNILLPAGILLLALCLSATLGLSSVASAADNKPAASAKADALHDAMRGLWDEHVVWTRLFIISAAADLPDLKVATARLLQNQTDIGNAIKPYYGEAAGNSLTTLLNEHITIAADLLKAAKAKDSAGLAAANKRWYANADAIAVFLSGANPDQWPRAAVQQMLYEHLGLTTKEVQARLSGDWAGDIEAYEQIHSQILEMADAFTAGIVAQFPGKF